MASSSFLSAYAALPLALASSHPAVFMLLLLLVAGRLLSILNHRKVKIASLVGVGYSVIEVRCMMMADRLNSIGFRSIDPKDRSNTACQSASRSVSKTRLEASTNLKRSTASRSVAVCLQSCRVGAALRQPAREKRRSIRHISRESASPRAQHVWAPGRATRPQNRPENRRSRTGVRRRAQCV